MTAWQPDKAPLIIYFILGLAVVAVSTAAVMIRLTEAPPLPIATLRLSIATLVLAPVVGLRYGKVILKLGKTNLKLIGVSGLALAIHFAFWISSLSYTSVASSMILVTTNPIFVAFLGHYLAIERISKQTLTGVAIALVGSIIIASRDLELSHSQFTGDLLAFIGAIAVAVYYLTARVLRSRVPLLAYLGPVYAVAAVILLLITLATGHTFLGYSGSSYLWIILVALIPQVIGHTALNWSLGYLSATMVSLSIVAEPVIASTMAVPILNEPISGVAVIGGTFVLCGVLLALRPNR